MTHLLTRRSLVSTGIGLAMATRMSPLYSQSMTGAQSAPRSPFGFESTAEDVTAGLDLSGKTALVTGCNSGIGHETMRVLALRGAHVIGTARTPEKAAAARDSVQGRVTPVVLELSDFDSVAACADEIDAMDLPIDMLICNAGVLYVAAHPSLAGVSGLYFADCNPAEQSEHQKDETMAARLWAVSEELTRGYI